MRSLWIALAIATLLACGSDPPEEQLAEAREQLGEARAEVKALEARVEARREAVKRAERSLAEARAKLDDAESELAAARKRIDTRATDVALFRSVQRALLENDELDEVAIRAEVNAGVVTLHGEVRTQAQAEAALETARRQPGVGEVRSRIQVRNLAETRT